MSYNLYVRKPKRGKLISPKISSEEFESAIHDSKIFVLTDIDGQSRPVAIFKSIKSDDELVIELYPNGQITTGWRMPLLDKDPYLLALIDLAKALNCEIVDEYGKIIHPTH